MKQYKSCFAESFQFPMSLGIWISEMEIVTKYITSLRHLNKDFLIFPIKNLIHVVPSFQSQLQYVTDLKKLSAEIFSWNEMVALLFIHDC